MIQQSNNHNPIFNGEIQPNEVTASSKLGISSTYITLVGMNGLRKICFMLLLTVFFRLDIHAQEHPDTLRYNVEMLSVNDGLSQGLISCILHDKEGLMWFGTKDGLNKYDGYRFTVYRKDEKNPWSIQGNYITGIVEDGQGYLWVGTYANGLFIFDKQTERFYPVKTHLQEIEKTTQPISPKVYQNGCILFGQHNTHIYQVDQVNLKQSTHIELKKEHLLFENRQDILAYRNGQKAYTFLAHYATNGDLWFASGDSFYVYRQTKNLRYQLTQTIPISQFGLHPSEYCFMEPVIGTPLLLFLNLDHFIVYDTVLRKIVNQFNFTGKDKNSRRIARDQKGNFFILADDQTFKYVPQENKLYAIYPALNGFMYVDKNNILWIGNPGLGIYKIDQRKNLFHHIQKYGALFAVASRQKEILVKRPYALKYIHPITLKSRDIIPPHLLKRCMGKHVEAVMELIDGRILMATTNDAAKKDIFHEVYDPKDSGLKSKKMAANNEQVHGQLIEDNQGLLWLCYFDPKNKPRLLRMSADGLEVLAQYEMPGNPVVTEHSYISAMHHDDQGILWLATIQGFYRFNPNANSKAQQWHHYNFVDGNQNNLPMNYMLSLLPDPLKPGRDFWIGTDGGGVLHFNKETDKFMRYTTAQGLPNDVVYAVLNDAEGNLWMSTNAGLSCFHRTQNRFINFNVEDGLPGNEFNRYEYQKIDAPHLLFGGTAGGVYFDPKEILEPDVKPNIIFSALTLNNKPVDFRKDSLILQKPIQFAEQITLPPDQSLFTVSFSALNYGGRLKKFYRYKLLGYSDNWVDAGNRNEATYTNLSPGTYTLYVQAAGRNGEWNPEGISLKIKVRPKWFQTWWFKLSILLAVSGIVFIFIRFRLKQQTAILRMRNTIAADLHDEMGSSLSSITLFSEVAEKMSTGNESLSGIIEKIKTNALEVQETMSDIVWAINTRHETLDQLLKRMRGFAVHLSEAKQFELIFPSDQHLPALTLDPAQRKNLYLVFKEAFNNAVKYAHCTQIRIEFDLQRDVMQLKIIDNGKGFLLNDQSFEPTHRGGGNGLFNMHKRVEALGGKLMLDSTIGVGTTVHILIHLKTRSRIL